MARIEKPKYPPRPPAKLAPKGESWKSYYTSLAAQYSITKNMSTDDMPDAFLADIFNYAFKAEIDWEQLDRLRAQENAAAAPAARPAGERLQTAKGNARETLDKLKADFVTPRLSGTAPELAGPARDYTPEEARALDPRSPENKAKHPHNEPAPAKAKTKRTSKAALARMAEPDAPPAAPAAEPPAKAAKAAKGTGRGKARAPLAETLAALDAAADMAAAAKEEKK
ncbi:hypothetical protein V8N76_004576 [Salmonella enterica]